MPREILKTLNLVKRTVSILKARTVRRLSNNLPKVAPRDKNRIAHRSTNLNRVHKRVPKLQSVWKAAAKFQPRHRPEGRPPSGSMKGGIWYMPNPKLV
jgi:hypothetical protein